MTDRAGDDPVPSDGSTKRARDLVWPLAVLLFVTLGLGLVMGHGLGSGLWQEQPTFVGVLPFLVAGWLESLRRLVARTSGRDVPGLRIAGSALLGIGVLGALILLVVQL
ncbi:hypothetical protein [Ruania alba]|uniref:Uncharacterized protein n=1 Tax=Ruania alba TaxID=648782 RepID=A0A1H5EJ75_9MICO|nr:hypothetical protein [Ruania alba]SED91172.1 hypothetical protein SAMN04488554_1040 [Ruania alba]